MTPTQTRTAATLDDLARVKEKAEFLGGRIVYLMPWGDLPNEIAVEIVVALRDHAGATKSGHAYTDGIGYCVPMLTSGRETFSPDASFFTGQCGPNRMRFLEGAPAFAVEVRSEGDYGPSAELDLATKRADYFEAGTLPVWDVDPIAQVVRKCGADQPDRPIVFTLGESADAEPAVLGWRMTVDMVFPSTGAMA